MQILSTSYQQSFSIHRKLNIKTPFENYSKVNSQAEKRKIHLYFCISEFEEEPKLYHSRTIQDFFLIAYMGQMRSVINEDCITDPDCSVTVRDYLHDFS